jgi:hypothetical protein
MAIIMKSGVARRGNMNTMYLVRNLWASGAFVVPQIKICGVSRGVI